MTIVRRKVFAELCAVLFLFTTIAVIDVIAAAPPPEWKAPARAAKKKNPVPADDASVAAGKIGYQKECLSCHGDTGKGNGPAAANLEVKPGDLSDPKLWAQTDGELFWKITEGKKPMPSYNKLFSDEQRWQIVNYVRTFAPKPAGAQGGDSSK
jgi:mono/diheme cytochrome c family protein